ncbi:VOC family protein [Shinella kummerowiae]|jgi:catechol 2,3-dioxygenase-like lactoylglutathione lyase family enzyme|uniref:VOC family protein n=1 Tax=Shinella kummerowiae TaxID=417745 RepID=UPI0021B5B0A6|nr:VOC family protein [Shinella kummerowiae]MCT7662734.1 VOC family protein [Shinella kummerowiae]
MISPGLLILYVEDPARSSRFYETILDRPPVFETPGYVGFDFGNGLGLGLWSTTSTEFVSGGTGNRSEIAIVVDGDAAIDALHDSWKADGIAIEQPPFTAVFGRTFVALDPDGHRVRVCPPDK